MLDRLGLVGRLILILLVVLIPLGIAGIGFALYSRAHETGTGLRFPLPDQAAAIADALDGAEGERRDVILRAVNSNDLRVTIVGARGPLPKGARSFPAAEWLVGRYLEASKTRQIEVAALASPDATWLSRQFELTSPLSNTPLRIAMSLRSGESLLIETRGGVTQRLFGVPVGFWIGTLGTLLAGLAVAAIVREARPISELSDAVAHFSREAVPRPVASRGAADVRGLISAVNDMQERIAALVKGRTILLGAVSHDLKTYITRLRLRVEDIAEEPVRERAIADLDQMTLLIDDAIAVARNATVSGRREPLDLALLLRAEVAERDPSTLSLRVGPGSHLVDGDPVGLKRLFSNLIDNALRYGSHCAVAMEAATDHITVLIDDNGPGIPEPERAAVFEPFVRLEPSRSRSTGGSGLGLTIVKQITDAHGGHITVETAPSGGARIRVVLRTGQ